ncbi:MAG: hypothetical protein HZB59_08555 [Ignavibacteriales bacterium]|nr:hypothetical protein [Ignavibacteriales bacterium]
MEKQSYKNHRRWVFGFHGILFLLVILLLGGSAVNLWKSFGDHTRVYSASLLFVVSICLLMLFFYSRSFALKAQDRAIRAEENLRHFILTGKPLDPKLTVRQIIGLRFAPDDEFVVLAKRAVEEKLSEDDIKRAVKNWKEDYYRV